MNNLRKGSSAGRVIARVIVEFKAHNLSSFVREGAIKQESIFLLLFMEEIRTPQVSFAKAYLCRPCSDKNTLLCLQAVHLWRPSSE